MIAPDKGQIAEALRHLGSDPTGKLAQLFEGAKATREERYPELRDVVRSGREKYATLLETLRREGYAVLRDAVPQETIRALRESVGGFLQEGRNVRRPWNVAELDTADDRSAESRADSRRLTDEELAQGMDSYRRLTNYVDLRDPLIDFPPVISLAFSDLFLDIAAAYLGCFPGLGYVKIRHSFVNGLQDFDSNFFHWDWMSASMLKAFVYLNDVDQGGGPTTFVAGSHRDRFDGWMAKERWTPEEMAAAYGDDRIVSMTARAGDVVFADATGFHRGAKPVSADRDIVWFDYLLHEESYVYGTGDAAKIARKDYEALSLKQRAAADFLEVV